MDFQSALMIALVALVCILGGLLIRRRPRVASRSPHLKASPDVDLHGHWVDSAVDGTIQSVAGRVSEHLKERLKCRRILFLRKQRGYLEVNYHFGFRELQRSEYRFRYSDNLLKVLNNSYLPRALPDVAHALPDDFAQRLQSAGLRWYFPVFWKENLYGLYFVGGETDLTKSDISQALAGLAYGLSAAYHVKWHESRNARLVDRLEQLRSRESRAGDRTAALNVIRLLRYKNPDTLFPKLLQAIRDALGVKRLACIHPTDGVDSQLVIQVAGTTGAVTEPNREAFEALVQRLPDIEVKPLEAERDDNEGIRAWVEDTVSAGFAKASCVSLVSGLRCLVLFDGDLTAEALRLWSEQLAVTAANLLAHVRSYEEIEALSYTDELTGLANKRYLEKRLDEEMGRARRYGRSLGFIMFDMDQLKQINDHYGHQAGDAVLHRLGEILRNSIRAIDIVARYGGDEFCVVMPEADLETCRQFMVRLRKQIASSRFELNNAGKTLECTICQGAAVFPAHADTSEALVFAADMALLRAKESGRNSFLVFETEMALS
jgi:diguanylate cyclase (GGDEF)-like protein